MKNKMKDKNRFNQKINNFDKYEGVIDQHINNNKTQKKYMQK